jgi:predicted RNase H-like HicB family nuclease
MTNTAYHIDVFYSAEDSCWIANVPDLPYCSAHGATPQKAVQEVMVALDLWLESAREHGDPIPTPSQPPAATATN